MKRLSIKLARRSRGKTGHAADPHVQRPHSGISPPSAASQSTSPVAPIDTPSTGVVNSSIPPQSNEANESTALSAVVTKRDYWQLAIDALQAEDHKESVKQRITVIQQEAAGSGNSDFASLLLQATQQSQRDLEAKRWTITTGSWNIRVRQQFDRTIKALQVFKELCQPAYNADPVHIGLPLAGLCVLMQLAISDSEQYAAMLEGVADIVVILTTYQHIEALYLARPNEDLTHQFEQHLISLY
ncbi:hypothetical protein LTR84_003154 [Exophiala bonariae]|uniref:NWD NACHT-NTPase N-terminal domain-containing protein n=1 Tax=Exophiala bonariae TaxID=1690606 RepID=A0AAV9N857_9EURO|nr:hypothetical protein LTR84_003154 [Exophiala bonariae]